MADKPMSLANLKTQPVQCRGITLEDLEGNQHVLDMLAADEDNVGEVIRDGNGVVTEVFHKDAKPVTLVSKSAVKQTKRHPATQAWFSRVRARTRTKTRSSSKTIKSITKQLEDIAAVKNSTEYLQLDEVTRAELDKNESLLKAALAEAKALAAKAKEKEAVTA